MMENCGDTAPPVLSVDRISIRFRQYEAGWKQREFTVMQDISLAIDAGQIVAVVGASGSGKSLLAHAVLGILPGNAQMGGTIRYCGQALTEERLAVLRGREIALIPQAVTYLDPTMKIGRQVQGLYGSLAEQRQALARYGLADGIAGQYPFSLSGGMARRVLIATAVMGQARLIIADEPTPGLDQQATAEVAGHFRSLADEGRAVMLITHELDLACRIADKIAVFCGGTILEIAAADDFRQGAEALRHPYSRALWQALPQNGFHSGGNFKPAVGPEVSGCLFADCCQEKSEACLGEIKLRQLRNGMVRCVHAT
ncbi:hypothetical protein P22_3504 [Propionispora sp. 2/2-37]|uniref:ATP-binding cassette domain-containing protein n=1 Tax=Propionispora sp. 2/2-37 TaxID=1677858 RepID=UPI0006C469A2|nr:ABC transporter ATP-binding protein [Propionispora sp. 2/2-37]CUH97376.1 hypothetical protein P22_3504 [Propionispora sp. 2/2-37]